MVQEGAVLERPSRVHRTGRAIVLIPGPYDNLCKKINGINTYDVFGSHTWLLNVNIAHFPPVVVHSIPDHFPLLCNHRNRKQTHERRAVMKDTVIIPMLVITTAILSRPSDQAFVTVVFKV